MNEIKEYSIQELTRLLMAQESEFNKAWARSASLETLKTMRKTIRDIQAEIIQRYPQNRL